MSQVATKFEKALSIKVTVKVIDLDVIWMDIIIWVCMPNMKSLSPMVQKLLTIYMQPVEDWNNMPLAA